MNYNIHPNNNNILIIIPYKFIENICNIVTNCINIYMIYEIKRLCQCAYIACKQKEEINYNGKY